MRAIWSVLLLAALTLVGVAQEGGGEPDKEKGGDKPAGKPEAPKEALAWKLSERDAKKAGKYLHEYLHPKRKHRKDILVDFQKFLDKPIDGHSALEDVAGLESIAVGERNFNKKCGKKGDGSPEPDDESDDKKPAKKDKKGKKGKDDKGK